MVWFTSGLIGGGLFETRPNFYNTLHWSCPDTVPDPVQFLHKPDMFSLDNSHTHEKVKQTINRMVVVKRGGTKLSSH